jgi:hypothetical protein
MIRDLQLNANPYSAQVLEVAASAGSEAAGEAGGARALAFRANPDAAVLRHAAHGHWGDWLHRHHGVHHAEAAAQARTQTKPQQAKRRAKPGGAGHGTDAMHDPSEAHIEDEEEAKQAGRMQAAPVHARHTAHVDRVHSRNHASRADTHTTLEEGDLTITGVQRRLDWEDEEDEALEGAHGVGLPPLAQAEVVALARNIHRDALSLAGIVGRGRAGGELGAAADGLLERAQRFLALTDPQASQLRFASSDAQDASSDSAPRARPGTPSRAVRTASAARAGATQRTSAARPPSAARIPRTSHEAAFAPIGAVANTAPPLQATRAPHVFGDNLRILLRRSYMRCERLLPRVVNLVKGSGSLGGFVFRDGHALEWFRGAGLGMASSTNPLHL